MERIFMCKATKQVLELTSFRKHVILNACRILFYEIIKGCRPFVLLGERHQLTASQKCCIYERWDTVRRVHNLKEKLLFLSTYTCIVFAAFYFGLPCIWQFLFGIPCPGCGMTRALFSVLRGDFSAAFSFHPMIFTLPLLPLYFIFDGRLFRKKQIDTIVLSFLLIGFLAQWIRKIFGL